MRELQLLYWLTLLGVTGLGVTKAREIHRKVPDYALAMDYRSEDWSSCGLTEEQAKALRHALVQGLHRNDAERILKHYQFIMEEDVEYPAALREIQTPPPLLFYLGRFVSNEQRIAVVGTRKCTAYGKRAAFETAQMLVHGDCCVVSGLALGIDRAAHRGALLAHGRTYAVLGSGIDVIYPAQNQELAKQIIETGGAVISEFLPWTGPERYRFPQRNRIISGLSKAVIIVEAGAKSGALITSAFALEQNRDVYAIPGSVFSLSSAGTNELISQGATPLLHPALTLSTLGIQVEHGLICDSERRDDPVIQRKQFVEDQEVEDIVQVEQLIIRELAAAPMLYEELLMALEANNICTQSIHTVIAVLEIRQVIHREHDGRYYLIGHTSLST